MAGSWVRGRAYKTGGRDVAPCRSRPGQAPPTYRRPVLALVLTFMLCALVVLGAVALHQRDRLATLEHRIEIERRHREHLTGIVERLQDRAAGIPPEPDVPVVELVLQGVGPVGFRQ